MIVLLFHAGYLGLGPLVWPVLILLVAGAGWAHPALQLGLLRLGQPLVLIEHQQTAVLGWSQGGLHLQPTGLV